MLFIFGLATPIRINVIKMLIDLIVLIILAVESDRLLFQALLCTYHLLEQETRVKILVQQILHELLFVATWIGLSGSVPVD